MDDIPEARRQVACGFFLLCLLAMLILVFLSACFPLISWAHLYSVHSPRAVQEAGPISAILIICTALSMPLGTVLRVQIGYQEGYVGDLWNAAGNAFALIGILIATRLGRGLPILVLAVAGAPLLMTATNWIIQFLYLRPWLLPRLNLFDLKESLNLARVGALFFVQQCFGLIYYVSDNVVIARMCGAAQVAHYVVFQKIFSIGLIAQYLMVPLWPAIGEAMAREDWNWAHTAARRAIMLSLVLGTLCGVCLLFASRYLMKKWSGIDVGPPDLLRIGFAIWVVLVGYIAAMNAILNQPGIMRRHLIYFGTGALLSVVLKIVFIRRWSLTGVVWGTIIGYGVAYVIPATRLALASTSRKVREAQ
jgi:O-antigen/teichoic acid export membrane protein